MQFSHCAVIGWRRVFRGERKTFSSGRKWSRSVPGRRLLSRRILSFGGGIRPRFAEKKLYSCLEEASRLSNICSAIQVQVGGEIPPVVAQLDTEVMHLLCTTLRYILRFSTVYYDTYAAAHDHNISNSVIM